MDIIKLMFFFAYVRYVVIFRFLSAIFIIAYTCLYLYHIISLIDYSKFGHPCLIKPEDLLDIAQAEMLKIGCPMAVKHNEVAPGQHEMSPVFRTANVSCDSNVCFMEASGNLPWGVRRGLYRILILIEVWMGVDNIFQDCLQISAAVCERLVPRHDK